MDRAHESNEKQARLWNGLAGRAWVDMQELLDQRAIRTIMLGRFGVNGSSTDAEYLVRLLRTCGVPQPTTHAFASSRGSRPGRDALPATRFAAAFVDLSTALARMVERRVIVPTGIPQSARQDFRRNDPRIQRITKNILDRIIGTTPTDVPSPCHH